MAVLKSNRIIKAFMAVVVFTVFVLPTCLKPCQATMKMEKVGHECCQKKDQASAKLKQPPCCESCRSLNSRPAVIPQSPQPTQDLAPSLSSGVSSLSSPHFESLTVFSNGAMAQAPPLYLSFKSLLC